MARVLILDDDLNIQLLLKDLVLSMGHEYASALNLADGLSMVKQDDYDLILLDLDFPKGNGLDILPALTRLPNSPEVIIVTGTGNTKGAEIAFKYGAWDYVKKPFLLEEVSLHITRALQYRTEKADRRAPMVLKRENIIGESEPIRMCLDDTAKAAATDTNVLITGETGTGKELFARAIHQNSNRSDKDFVIVDCGAFPETLSESILFGHEKGAFTGANFTREGIIAQAHGGTLFLDEIGELDPVIQKKLLRTLQEHRIRPVGAQKELPVNFRLVAATNRDLDKMVRENRFREDLYFRIRGIEIKLPALRQRNEDIPLIALKKMQQIGNRFGLGTKGVSAEYMETLKKYDWPGNVRELINVLDHSIANAGSDPTLVTKHLPSTYRATLFERDANNLPEGNTISIKDACLTTDGKLARWVDYRFQIEKTYLQSLLSKCNGSWENACHLSGLGKTRLYELLKKHNLSLEKQSFSLSPG